VKEVKEVKEVKTPSLTLPLVKGGGDMLLDLQRIRASVIAASLTSFTSFTSFTAEGRRPQASLHHDIHCVKHLVPRIHDFQRCALIAPLESGRLQCDLLFAAGTVDGEASAGYADQHSA